MQHGGPRFKDDVNAPRSTKRSWLPFSRKDVLLCVSRLSSSRTFVSKVGLGWVWSLEGPVVPNLRRYDWSPRGCLLLLWMVSFGRPKHHPKELQDPEARHPQKRMVCVWCLSLTCSHILLRNTRFGRQTFAATTSSDYCWFFSEFPAFQKR